MKTGITGTIIIAFIIVLFSSCGEPTYTQRSYYYDGYHDRYRYDHPRHYYRRYREPRAGIDVRIHN